jgi:tetratricopeptide (TPR) repeat protein
VGNDDGYIFKHPLLQDTIYQTLLNRDRTILHSQVAQVIISGDYWLPGERNQILAYHLSESDEPSKAIPYLLLSAQKAYQHFANDTVIQLYRQALSLMESAEEIETGQKEMALVGLAQALKFTGELEDSAKILADIVEKIPDIGTKEQGKDNPLFQTQIEALRELADIRSREGNMDLAVTLLKNGLDMLGEKGRDNHPNIWRRLIDRLAWVYFRQRNLEEAHNLADLALSNTPTSEAEDPITLASLYNTIGGIYWTQSRFADAIESVEQSLEIYKNLHYHWGMANSLTNLGILHFSTEKWPQAVDYLEQADRLRSEYGDDPERPVNLKNLGEVLIYKGDFENAR